MELIINDITHVLKSVNIERRNIFVQKVLSIYDYNCSDFNAFLKQTQNILKEKHKIEIPLKKVEIDFFKLYSTNLYQSIWSFLSPNSKHILKKINNINIEKNELVRFIEHVCSKIRLYSTYVKVNHNKTNSEDIHSVYSYLSRIYGWTYEEIKEMDELELVKSIENATQIVERENANNINSQALAGAYASGSKNAKTQIDSINRRVSIKSKMKYASKNSLKEDNISREDIKKIMEENNV